MGERDERERESNRVWISINSSSLQHAIMCAVWKENFNPKTDVYLKLIAYLHSLHLIQERVQERGGDDKQTEQKWKNIKLTEVHWKYD